jgi:hypothetical protein
VAPNQRRPQLFVSAVAVFIVFVLLIPERVGVLWHRVRVRIGVSLPCWWFVAEVTSLGRLSSMRVCSVVLAGAACGLVDLRDAGRLRHHSVEARTRGRHPRGRV